ncbi:low molecular weight protein-tyrosine-phosphatase [Paenibacillus koleovorans]|uniref:low molecular weight protein-tyrosine-phosphatase n=1 Tax=Paenibacillus koleovorans TaxID=121608 RepID=UPI000FD6F35C|nr:low molecular weight protein-tyrosine-phosphatase [Paenibacillus koleovorans]
MIRVLFVCLGNICRSPMAEAVFRRMVQEAGHIDRIEVDSAGTGDWHVGEPPHRGTRELLRKRGIDHEGMLARQVKRSDFADFHYIVAMDSTNRDDLQKLARENEAEKEKVVLILDFLPNEKRKDVPDPYFTGNFEEVYRLLDGSCRRLLEHIIERHERL